MCLVNSYYLFERSPLSTYTFDKCTQNENISSTTWIILLAINQACDSSQILASINLTFEPDQFGDNGTCRGRIQHSLQRW